MTKINATNPCVNTSATPAVASDKKEQKAAGGNPALTSTVFSSPWSIFDGRVGKWKGLIKTFLAAQKAKVGDELYQKAIKIFNGIPCEPLTGEEEDKISSFLDSTAVKDVETEARHLFFDAYRSADGSLDPKKAMSLRSFLDLADASGVQNGVLFDISCLMDPDISDSDRKLAVDFLFVAKDKKTTMDKLVRRISDSSVRSVMAYDGINDPEANAEARSIAALSNAVGRYVSDELDRAFTDFMLNNIDFEKIIAADPTLSEIVGTLKVIHKGVDPIFAKEAEAIKGNILKYRTQLDDRLSTLPVGSPEKIRTYKALYILDKVLVHYGISGREITKASYRNALSSPDSVELDELLKWEGIFYSAAATRQKADNRVLRPYLVGKIKETVKLICSNASPFMKMALLDVLNTYQGNLADYDITIEEYRDMISPIVPGKPEHPLKSGNLGEHNIMIIRPQDLPAAMIAKLKATGTWEGVSKACFVVLRKEIGGANTGLSKGFGKAGEVAAGLFISLDVYDEDNKRPYGEDELVAVLAHEGAHVAWFVNNYSNSTLMSTALNERNAFIVGMKATSALIKEAIKGKRDPEAVRKLCDRMGMEMRCIVNANRVLGYPDNDLSFRCDLPYPQRDINVYPTVPSPYHMEGEMQDYIAQLGPSLGDRRYNTMSDPQSGIKIRFIWNGLEKMEEFHATVLDVTGVAEDEKRKLVKEVLAKMLTDLGEIQKGEKDPANAVLFQLGFMSDPVNVSRFNYEIDISTVRWDLLNRLMMDKYSKTILSNALRGKDLFKGM